VHLHGVFFGVEYQSLRRNLLPPGPPLVSVLLLVLGPRPLLPPAVSNQDPAGPRELLILLPVSQPALHLVMALMLRPPL
jgi:hypothetical protein